MQGDNPGADEVGRGYDVFLSYAHLDAEHDVANARQLARWLDSLGYDVWWDRALVAGQKWPKTLSAKVRASKRVVVLWSPRAAKSDWVKFETNLATTEDITLVPIIIEPEPVPGHWGEIHRVTLSGEIGDTHQFHVGYRGTVEIGVCPQFHRVPNFTPARAMRRQPFGRDAPAPLRPDKVRDGVRTHWKVR